jgi:hypothetical protein
MATIRISVLIDTTNDIDDLDDIKGDLLTVVGKMVIKNPEKFLLKELDHEDESDVVEMDEHDPRITVFHNSKEA